jgi:ABC-type Mn2+/Zn2+ transport system permease subunit
LEFLSTLFEFPFMSRALLAVAVLGMVLPFIGVFVVLRSLSFAGEGLAHAAFMGVALAAFLGVSPDIPAIVLCCAVALLLAFFEDSHGKGNDARVGVFFSASMGVGLVLLSAVPAKSFDVVGVLFGSILGISAWDLAFSLVLSLSVFVVFIVLYKEFVALTFDAAGARLSGVPERKLRYLFYLCLALIVVSSLRLLGTVLVTALLVTPAAAALALSKNIDRVVVLSSLIGLISGIGGFGIAFNLDTPPGATIALLSTLCFLVSYLVSKRRG